jgi:hypothetical protein
LLLGFGKAIECVEAVHSLGTGSACWRFSVNVRINWTSYQASRLREIAPAAGTDQQ